MPELLNTFVSQYILCALWSSTDDNGDSLGDNYSADDLTEESYAKIVEECTAFLTENVEHIPPSRCGSAGYDFWLNRNGHGCGFWDGDWPKPAATILDEASKKAGGRYVMVGDDGKLYYENG